MEDADVYLDSAQRIMNLIRANFSKIFTAYFIGLPLNIPKAAFPAVVVQKISGTYTVGATGTDESTDTVYIHLLMNRQDGAGTPEDDDTVMRKLQNLVEGRDQTGAFMPVTLMYLLRRDLTFGNTNAHNNYTVNNDIHIVYNTPQSAEVPYQAEVVIEVTITNRQIMPGRSTTN